MRIFKNKITFWYLCFEWNLNGIFTSHRFLCGLLGLEKVPQISRMNTDFFDLCGQIYVDYLRTYAVPLIGDRNLKGWLSFLRNRIAIVCRLAEDFMAYDAL